jgi:PAS domain S-box-containing protein
MNKSYRKRRQLLEEFQELRSRAMEAEETLRAIRGGEVDALVVSTGEGDRVFTLTGADQPYRVMVETMNEGAVTLTPDGTILFCNQRFADMIKESLEKVTGSSIFQYLSSTGLQIFKDLLKRGLAGKCRVELALQTEAENTVPVLLSISALEQTDTPGLACLVVTDLTDQKQSEKQIRERTVELERTNKDLAEKSRLLESFFRDTITPLVLLDRDFNFIRVNEAYSRSCQRAVADFPGHNHFELYPHEENQAIFRRVVENKAPFQAVAKPFCFPDHPEWGVTFWDWTLTPLLDDQGEVVSLVFSLAEVTDRQTAEEALRNSERELRILADQLIHAQENERRRIARDMHDSLGASLSALKYKMENLAHSWPDSDPQQINETLGRLISIIQETIGEARRMQNDLRPPHLDELGILSTLSWLAREFQKTYSNIAVEQEFEVREEDVPEPLKVIIFRITQEALNNSGKHSQATQIQVSLGRQQDRLKLVIRDNGIGLDTKRGPESAEPRRGMGLSSMKERAELSGGVFSLKSRPGDGLVIDVSWQFNNTMGGGEPGGLIL